MKRRPFLQLAGLSTLSGLLGVRSDAWAAPARPTERFRAGWSFVLLPDTQCYTRSHPEVFTAQTEWIAREQETRGIRFVLHLGDITDHNTHPQWINAHQSMQVLTQAGIPFLMVPGNHDLGQWGTTTDRTSHFSDYFIQSRCMVPGESENAYLTVTVGDAKWLMIGLEFGPRDAVVEWANGVVAAHPDHHAILVTHAYLYSDGNRYDWNGRGRDQSWNPVGYPIGITPELAIEGVNDGEALWRKLVSRHRQFVFTFNGHVLNDGIGYLESGGEHGNAVHQMLVNYQCGTVPDRGMGGGGFLRLVEVGADGRTIRIRDYSPYFDQWLTDPDRSFTIIADRDLNASIPGDLISLPGR